MKMGSADTEIIQSKEAQRGFYPCVRSKVKAFVKEPD